MSGTSRIQQTERIAVKPTVENALPIITKLLDEVLKPALIASDKGAAAYESIKSTLIRINESQCASELDLIILFGSACSLKESLSGLTKHSARWIVDKLIAEKVPEMRAHIYVEKTNDPILEKMPREWLAETVNPKILQLQMDLDMELVELQRQIEEKEGRKTEKPVTEADHYRDAAELGSVVTDNAPDIIACLAEQWNIFSYDQKIAAAVILLECAAGISNGERFENYISPRNAAFRSPRC